MTADRRDLRPFRARVAFPALAALLLLAGACASSKSSDPTTGAPTAAARPRVEFVAHRGESADAPENTLAAFRLAWQRGDPAVELDVHLTRDGKLIVSHDADTRRTTGVPKVIKESMRDELRTLDAGRWKGAQFAGERLPTLEEALATIPAGARLFIEVKVGAEAIPALVEAVRASGKAPAQLAVISFQLDAVAEAKRRLPEIPAYYLASFNRDSATGAWAPTIDALIARARGAKLDGLDLAYTGPLDADAARRIRAAGLALHVWTVDDPEVARRLIGYGVDGITTNRAAALRAAVGAR
jgi:glycerophosphoryl diester phosphodiesterase